MNKTVHMSLSVRGALKWPARKLKQMFRDQETGQYVSADTARELLLDELSKGNEVLPLADCEGFDPKTGCPGHPEVA